ncbi:sulfotransferase family 2 domain-containing protein [Nocardioides coralli]|uniref:sulfotransferase family 2 domain-containing protein n=1 Tax=Nocardioides coralli TaxID=2872154 RepID=UPI0020175B76|nr:sulfotransferase family 2 domain-containing protein [Nocardioides coralli]
MRDLRRLVDGWIAGSPVFPRRYELAFPTSGLRYTYIPKNGCSTLKLSLGRHEGWLAAGSDPHAISARHRLLGLVRCRRPEVRFVVLRDPLQRLASAFLDRFSKPADHSTQSLKKLGLLSRGQTLGDVTFEQFVEFLLDLPRGRMDPHWRPQVDFMYGPYTHYFSFENFDHCLSMLRQRGVSIHQHRPHATSRYRPVGRFVGQLPARELLELRSSRSIAPTAEELVSPRVSSLVTTLYASDYALMENVDFA